MLGLSFGEILILGVMALILIGPKQLPEVARTIGRFLNELKRASEGITDEIKKQARVEFDMRPSPPPQDPALVARETPPPPPIEEHTILPDHPPMVDYPPTPKKDDHES